MNSVNPYMHLQPNYIFLYSALQVPYTATSGLCLWSVTHMDLEAPVLLTSSIFGRSFCKLRAVLCCFLARKILRHFPQQVPRISLSHLWQFSCSFPVVCVAAK